MFSRDVKDFRYRTPRTLNEAFGAYSTAKLHIPRRQWRAAPVLWMAAYGGAIGLVWYGIVLWVTR